jgi:hypothetical protein
MRERAPPGHDGAPSVVRGVTLDQPFERALEHRLERLERPWQSKKRLVRVTD